MKNFILQLQILLLLLTNCTGNVEPPKPVKVNWEYAFTKNGKNIPIEFKNFQSIEDLENLSGTSSGFLFLKGNFELEKQTEDFYSLFMDYINPTDETYLNGVLIGKTGLIPENDGYFFSAWNEVRNYQLEKKIIKEKDNELLIKIYFEKEISFSGSIRIGDKKKLDKLKSKLDFFRSFIYLPTFLMLVVLAGFYFLVYSKSKKYQEFLYYGLLAIISAISQLNFFILKLPIELDKFFSYFNFQKLIFASICFFPWALIMYINSVLRKEIRRWEMAIYFCFTILPGLVFLFSPDYNFLVSFRIPLFVFVTLSSLAYLLPMVVYKTIIKHKNAIVFLLGLIPFAACVIFDLIIHNFTRNDEYIYLGFLGMPSFIIAIGVLQANEFVKYRIQLEELNKSLEKRVSKRTEKLLLAKEETDRAILEMERLARIDNLTKLFNRLHVMNTLEMEFQRAKRYKLYFSILLMDIDYFKTINDTFGHLGGDEALRHIGKLIAKTFRSIDIAGRFGGEEFCIILPNTKGEDAFLAAEKLRTAVENSICNYNDKEIKFTCSIGVAEYCNDDPDFPAIIERADNSLYTAKKTGRNKTVRK